MVFQVEVVAFELVGSLQSILPQIKKHDRSLADQLTRAASSAALNIAESNYSDPGNRRARLFTAAGSANETRAALRLAVSLGYCEAGATATAAALADRVIAMLWRLTRGNNSEAIAKAKAIAKAHTIALAIAQAHGFFPNFRKLTLHVARRGGHEGYREVGGG